jgi:signal peptide peptidase SppA
MSALEAALTAHWAMMPDSLERLCAIAARENDPSPEVLEAYRAEAAARGERMSQRDGVAILDVSGPLFKKANLFVRVSGATSYEIMRRDLQVALDDPAIHAVMLKVDSPGGEANGCDELAAAIYDARGKKPIWAYVSGMACSGGYWLASAADRVIISEAAVLGSIGVVLGVTDRKKADEKNGVTRLEFVSSQSPGKRPDVHTDEGKARIQKMVDDLAQVFVSAVAKHRGVTPESVIQKFGAGGVEIGANAVSLGMADEVGQFESAFAELSKRGKNRRISQRSIGGFLMSNSNNAAVEGGNTVDVAKIQTDAAEKAKAETLARVKAIQTSEEGKARPKLAEHLAFNTDMPAEAAVQLMKAAAAETGEGAESKEKTFEKQKADAGALGLGAPEPRGKPAASEDGWSKAVSLANPR